MPNGSILDLADARIELEDIKQKEALLMRSLAELD